MAQKIGGKKLWRRLVRTADEEVHRSLQALPAKLRQMSEKIPCVYESYPNPELQAEGVERDILGLFVGEAFPDSGRDLLPLPPQIFLFLDNIWDYSGHNMRNYRQEVTQTYLHELGHYVGFDEEELEKRGMD